MFKKLVRLLNETRGTKSLVLQTGDLMQMLAIEYISTEGIPVLGGPGQTD